MQSNGILPGRNECRKVLRIQSIEPQSAKLMAAQIGIIADIAEKYGSGQVHITARQAMEIPDVEFGQVIADCVDNFEILGIIEKVLKNYQKKAILRPFNSKKKNVLVK